MDDTGGKVVARIRQIHIGLGENEELSNAGTDVMIVAALLPCIADRKGRLKDIPVKIHGELLPHLPQLDMDGILGQLSTAGYITRYEVEGRHYIQINNFERYQRPHPKEIESVIPGMTKGNTLGTPTGSTLGTALPHEYRNTDTVTDTVTEATTPTPIVDNSELSVRLSALEIFNDWINEQDNRDKVATLTKFYGESFVRSELLKVRAWLTANDLKAFMSWERMSVGTGYTEGILPWLNAWLQREKAKPAKTTVPFTAQQEKEHYESHRRDNQTTSGFERVGE